MQRRNEVLVALVVTSVFCITGISSSFHYGNDFIEPPSGELTEDYLRNEKLRVAKRYYDDFSMNTSVTTVKRTKRYEDGTFVGHPKTREERWHANFNLNRTNDQIEQAQSLVNLLVKVMDKYLNDCIPIVLYDQPVASSEGNILQIFFKVNASYPVIQPYSVKVQLILFIFFPTILYTIQSIKLTYLHGLINENYTVVNQDLLQPYDKSCRSYIMFLSDVLQTREVLGPQTKNRVILIPRSTQWKLQEFLSSKQASDIVNLLVVGESLTSDPRKVISTLSYSIASRLIFIIEFWLQ